MKETERERHGACTAMYWTSGPGNHGHFTLWYSAIAERSLEEITLPQQSVSPGFCFDQQQASSMSSYDST